MPSTKQLPAILKSEHKSTIREYEKQLEFSFKAAEGGALNAWRKYLPFSGHASENRSRAIIRVTLDLFPFLEGIPNDVLSNMLRDLFRATRHYRLETTDLLNVGRHDIMQSTDFHPADLIDALLFRILLKDAENGMDLPAWRSKAGFFVGELASNQVSRGRIWNGPYCTQTQWPAPWSSIKELKNRVWQQDPDLILLLLALKEQTYAEQLALCGYDLTPALSSLFSAYGTASENTKSHLLEDMTSLLAAVNVPLHHHFQSQTLNPLSWSLKRTWNGIKPEKGDGILMTEEDFSYFIRLHMFAKSDAEAAFLKQARWYLKHVARITILDHF
ncbi:MAG: hypothetical protein ABJN40_03995 [Sneathiella sp.]